MRLPLFSANLTCLIEGRGRPFQVGAVQESTASWRVSTPSSTIKRGYDHEKNALCRSHCTNHPCFRPLRGLVGQRRRTHEVEGCRHFQQRCGADPLQELRRNRLQGTQEEIKAAFDGYFAYFGPYEVNYGSLDLGAREIKVNEVFHLCSLSCE